MSEPTAAEARVARLGLGHSDEISVSGREQCHAFLELLPWSEADDAASRNDDFLLRFFGISSCLGSRCFDNESAKTTDGNVLALRETTADLMHDELQHFTDLLGWISVVF